MNRLTDVVRHLLIINVLLYFGSLILGEAQFGYNLKSLCQLSFQDWGRYILAVFYPSSEMFRPYQLVTHMFMHADIGHLFFNMLGLFFFGPPLEALWGARRFLFYYLFTGFGALALHLLVKYLEINMLSGVADLACVPTLGASGAIFGLLAGYAANFPNNIISLIFPPISMKAKYFVLIYAGLELYMGIGGFSSGVAHFAHLGGAISGYLLIVYWRNFGTRL